MQLITKKLLVTAAILWSITGYVFVSNMDYEDATVKENWIAAEQIAMQQAEANARRYELEALRESLEFTDAPHERRYILEKIKELENDAN